MKTSSAKLFATQFSNILHKQHNKPGFLIKKKKKEKENRYVHLVCDRSVDLDITSYTEEIHAYFGGHGRDIGFF